MTRDLSEILILSLNHLLFIVHRSFEPLQESAMKATLYFIFMLILMGNTYAQTFEWIKGKDINYSMNPSNIHYTIEADLNGKIWFCGMKQFVQSYNTAMGHLFLSAYSSDGEVTDDYTITGSAVIRDLASDAEGNLYLTGQYISDLGFWDGTTLPFTGPFINGFLVKISSTGSIIWKNNISLLYPDAVPEDLLYEGNKLYLAHSSWLSSNISVFDATGEVILDIEQSGVGISSSVAADANGNIYVTGSCPDSGSQFGGISFPAPFPYSLYLVKYSPEGVPEWVKFTEDITCTRTYVAMNGNGNIIWGGALNNSTLIDTMAFHGPSWVYDFFITSFDPDGHIQWGMEVPQVMTGDASLGESRPFCINQDHTISITGLLRGTVDWGNGVISEGIMGNYETLVLTLSADGEALWSKSSSASSFNQGIAITHDPSGNLYVSGIAHGLLELDTCSYTNPSYYYPFLAKLNAGNTTGTVASESSKIMLIPNPSVDFLKIYRDHQHVCSVSILTLSGTELMNAVTSDNPVTMDVSRLKPGIYLVKIHDGSTAHVEKLLIR